MYLFTGIVVAAFVFSFWKDNRSLWNPALFLLSLISIYLSVAHFFIRMDMKRLTYSFWYLPLSSFLFCFF